MMPTNSPVLRADLTKAPSEIVSMFNHVAERYDLTNLIMTGGMDRTWMKAFRNAVAPLPGEKVPDVAAGTGASCAVLAKAGAGVTACDLSEGIIEVGRKRHPDIEFIQGNAMELPFEEASFDVVTISWGLCSTPDPELTLREMARVMRPKGRLAAHEFSTPLNPLFRSLYGCYQSSVLKYLTKAFSSDEAVYDYFVESIRDWPDQRTIGEMITRNGWVSAEYHNLTSGIAALHRAAKPLPRGLRASARKREEKDAAN